jgi:hypothetical protein
MRSRLCAAVAVTTALLTLGAGVAQAGATGVPGKARQEAPAKKKKKQKATTTTVAKSASFPSDACKLLTLSEITPLIPTATEGTASPSTNNGPLKEVGCRWEAPFDPAGPIVLQDIVLKVSTLPPGTPFSQLKFLMDAEAKDPGHEKVSGLGESAFVSSVIPPNAEVQVLLKKLLFNIEYSSDDPLGSTRQDEVVALAKLALGRL